MHSRQTYAQSLNMHVLSHIRYFTSQVSTRQPCLTSTLRCGIRVALYSQRHHSTPNNQFTIKVISRQTRQTPFLPTPIHFVGPRRLRDFIYWQPVLHLRELKWSFLVSPLVPVVLSQVLLRTAQFYETFVRSPALRDRLRPEHHVDCSSGQAYTHDSRDGDPSFYSPRESMNLWRRTCVLSW